MRKEIKPLTSLRAVAAALVFFYHFVYLRNQVPASNVIEMITQNGFIGVNIMFVLSGFVLTLRYYGDVEAKKLRWREYIKRRAARLYPSYFVLLAGIALLGVPINAANATMTQGFFTGYFQTGIINTWSLTAEECFYFVLPLLLWVLVRRQGLRSSTLVLAAWTFGLLGIGLGLVNWSNVSGMAQGAGFMGDSTFMLYRTFFGYGFEFAVGIFAALLYRKRGAYSHNVSMGLMVISLSGIVACVVLMTHYPSDLTIRLLRYAVGAFSGVLILALTCESMWLSRMLSCRPLVYLGRLSYGLYLIQLTQLVWFMAGWPVLLFYAGCTVVSALLYHLIEQPARNLLLKRGKPTPQTPMPAYPPVPTIAFSPAVVQNRDNRRLERELAR